jgi:hypothetical protein
LERREGAMGSMKMAVGWVAAKDSRLEVELDFLKD